MALSHFWKRIPRCIITIHIAWHMHCQRWSAILHAVGLLILKHRYHQMKNVCSHCNGTYLRSKVVPTLNRAEIKSGYQITPDSRTGACGHLLHSSDGRAIATAAWMLHSEIVLPPLLAREICYGCIGIETHDTSQYICNSTSLVYATWSSNDMKHIPAA